MSSSLKNEVLLALLCCKPLSIEQVLKCVTVTDHASRVHLILNEMKKAGVVRMDGDGSYFLNVPNRITDLRSEVIPEPAPMPLSTAVPVKVSNVRLKMDVLRRLEPIVAEGISEVLGSIRVDLGRLAG